MRILNLKIFNNNLGNPEYCEEDKLLLKQASSGDETAWIKIVKKYGNLILNICFQYTGNIQIAEDITQDIFVKIFDKCSILSKHPNFKYWLIRTTKNKCIDYYRKNKVSRCISTVDFNSLKIKTLDSPESKILLSEKIKQLHKAITKLPYSLQTLIILRDINEFSYEEIAKILKIPIGTVKSKLNRARLELFKLLGTFEYFNS